VCRHAVQAKRKKKDGRIDGQRQSAFGIFQEALTVIIRTRSIGEARPGDLATYRWGSLRDFEDGRIFAPSEELLSAYKYGGLSWEAYERQYLAEMEAFYQKSPGCFIELLQRGEVTLVCFETRPDRCHRRLLAGLLAGIAREQGIEVVLDIQ
jgi:hypothetical protein